MKKSSTKTIDNIVGKQSLRITTVQYATELVMMCEAFFRDRNCRVFKDDGFPIHICLRVNPDEGWSRLLIAYKIHNRNSEVMYDATNGKENQQSKPGAWESYVEQAHAKWFVPQDAPGEAYEQRHKQLNENLRAIRGRLY